MFHTSTIRGLPRATDWQLHIAVCGGNGGRQWMDAWRELCCLLAEEMVHTEQTDYCSVVVFVRDFVRGRNCLSSEPDLTKMRNISFQWDRIMCGKTRINIWV